MGDAISRILGLRKEPSSTLEMALAIQKGLPARSIAAVCKRLSLPDPQAAEALGVTAAALSRLRRYPAKRLDAAVSDRLYRMANLFLLAADVLSGEETAREWLLSPQPGLGNHVPYELISTEASAREVEDLLLRIDHGVLS